MKRVWFAILAVALLVPGLALAQERLGWVGPIYTELAESLREGFKAYYLREFGKEIEITFVKPGGWPVCVDKVRLWGGKPDADVFLGAGAPAHELLKSLGLTVPYKPKGWDAIPAEWGGMLVKDPELYWTCFAPWLVTNIYNEKVLKKLRLPVPSTWEDLLDPVYRGNIVHTLPYASGTMHETVEIILQTMGEEEGWAYLRYLAANLARFSTGSTDTLQIVARGEVPIGVAQPQMNAMAARKDGYPVAALVPDKTIMVPEAAALLAGAPNEENGKIFLDWLYSPEGQQYVVKGLYFPARSDISLSAWAEEGIKEAEYALGALGVDNFWDLEVELIEYDLDLAEERWDAVNKTYELEIYRKWGELKSTLSLIEEVEGEVEAAREAGKDVAAAEAKIKEARTLFEKGEYAAARLLALEARNLLVKG